MSREHRVLAGLLVHDQAHRDAGDRRLERHAGVHHRQRAAADRRHRRRAVRLEDVGDDADGVGELSSAGIIGASARSASAPWPISRRPGPRRNCDFADRERREVVVEHEALPRLAVDHLDLLLVVGGAERGGDERLGLAAREHRRAVGARQHADFDRDRADLVERAAVEPLAALERFVAHDLFLQLLEDRLRVAAPLDFVLGDAGHQVGQHLVDRAVVLELVLDAHRLARAARRPSPRPRGRTRARSPCAGHRASGLPTLARPAPRCRRRSRLIAAWRELERLDDLLLGDFLRARFDHHDRVFAAGDDQIEAADLRRCSKVGLMT